MIRVHEFDMSRYFPVVWVLEKFELGYEPIRHRRGQTCPAPPSLFAVHPR